MSITTYTQTATFTVIHAKQIASKVAADLLRFQRFYGKPTDDWIASHEAEIIELLKHDVVKEVVYGFQRNGQWTEASVRYTALPGGSLNANDDPGKISPNFDIADAHFTSYLKYNSKWHNLTPAEKVEIQSAYTLRRVGAPIPTLEAGVWASDLSYTAGGRGMGRSSVKK